MTQFIGVSPSAPLGSRQFYRLVIDVSGQILYASSSDVRLSYIYEHMQDTRALAPLSPNPATEGAEVMTVDAQVIDPAITVAEAVRRLEMVAGQLVGIDTQPTVRSITKLSGIGDVTGGADDRDQQTDAANKDNAGATLGAQLRNLFSGLGDAGGLLVIGLVAYAAIVLAPTISGLPFGRRK